MKIFNKIKSVLPVGAESKSKQMVAKVELLLMEAGMNDGRNRNFCATAMFRKTVKHFRQLQRAALGKGNVDDVAKKWTDELKAVMDAYDLTDVQKQEDIILEFMDIMADMA